MSFIEGYDPAHFLDDDDDEPPFVDGCDVPFLTGWTLGRIWARLQTSSIVRAVVPTYGTEMVIRIAEAKGLPFKAEYLSDTFMLVQIGTPAERTV